jgi:hypothetical protein
LESGSSGTGDGRSSCSLTKSLQVDHDFFLIHVAIDITYYFGLVLIYDSSFSDFQTVPTSALPDQLDVLLVAPLFFIPFSTKSPSMSSGPRLIHNAATRRLLIQCKYANSTFFDVRLTFIRPAYARLFPSSPISALSRSRIGRDLPPRLSALAIALPRTYATETGTHGSSDGGPPPGFDINEARKPLPKDETKKSATAKPSVAELMKSDEQTSVPKSTATATAKTQALENATLSELAADKAATTPAQTASTEIAAKKEGEKKLTLGQKIKKEVQHYWDGTKLLAAEVRISTKLALKMAAGYELSRRENRQVRPSHPIP